MTRLGRAVRAVAFAFAWVTLLGCSRPEASLERDSAGLLESVSDQPIEPLPLRVDVKLGLASLGEALFKEPALSGDGKVSCASCHPADRALADHRSRTLVAGRPEMPVNTPTLYNVRFLYKLRWDGKFDAVEKHLDALIQNPIVMASTWAGAVERLARMPGYAQRFSVLFKDGLTRENLRSALAEYECSLITPNAPFDRYLRGDERAISAEAKSGYALFKSYGCASCHQGIAIGGNLFQRFGVLRDYFADRGHIEPADFGRFNVTGREEDRFVFRVPSLRNVALTAPYFHDGSGATLEDAVRVMAYYQLGRELDVKDRDSIVLFLRSLTGEYRGRPP